MWKMNIPCVDFGGIGLVMPINRGQNMKTLTSQLLDGGEKSQIV